MYILIGVNDLKNHVYICMTGILKILAPFNHWLTKNPIHDGICK